MEFKGTKKFNVNYHTTMNLPYKYIISDIQETDEEAEANALLISKAPEMLEMLKAFYNTNSSHEITLSKLQDKVGKLIKEATKL